MSATDIASVRHHCHRDYPFECCGLLLGHRDGSQAIVSRVVVGLNVADGDRSRNYQIDWPTLFHAIKQARVSGESIVGFYHSHPDCEPKPSKADRIAAWIDYVYLIVPVRRGVVGEPAAWCVSDPLGKFEPIAIEMSS